MENILDNLKLINQTDTRQQEKTKTLPKRNLRHNLHSHGNKRRQRA